MDRNEIINNYSKDDFSKYLENDYEGKILGLMNSEGLAILENSPLKEERIVYILTFSKYRNELFKNSEFLDVFFKTDFSYYYACLGNLQSETYDLILDKYLKLNPSAEDFAIFFSYFNKNYKLEKIKNWPYGIDTLYKIINVEDSGILAYIISNYNIDLSDRRINIEGLISKAKQSVLKMQEDRNMFNEIKPAIDIPVHMVNKNLAKRLLETYDIFKLRRILNNLCFCTDPEEVNNYIKNKEDNIINSYIENTLNSPYHEIFKLFQKMNEMDEMNEFDTYYTIRKEYIKTINACNNKDINDIIQEKYKQSGISGVYNYLKEQSERKISDYIIDYNFEENYYNVMLDVRELLRFYYDGNVILQKEHVELYEQISNIDYLSVEEKKQLHNILKQINIKEIFYDDMALARYIVNETIKEMSLNRESIKKYRDEKLSKENGVDVYVMNNEPFFGIVKTGIHVSDNLPTGHSYSLIGNDCIAVFGDSKNSNTFLYDSEDLNPEQIVHVFPFDSFTLFKPFNAVDTATNRVNMLMMPEEITGLSAKCYSELLILEQGNDQTDIDEKIPKLKRIALYCVDEIRQQDVEKAQQLGLGIILIPSKKYFENQGYYKEKYKDFDNWNYKYFNDEFEKDEFESKR